MSAHRSRFIMNFSNKGNLEGLFAAPFHNNVVSNLAPAPKAKMASSKGEFNTPMISRVHKARAGCSACGKKMM